MKNLFKQGDNKELRFVVKESDFATFDGEVVHSVCSTFSLAREIEWATRQFVLEMRDGDEEGVGTFLTIEHLNPAFVNEEIKISSAVESINGHEIICSYIARVGERIIATGKTGQKIFRRDKIATMFRKPESL